MKLSRSTRSSGTAKNSSEPTNVAKVPALRKVFYISQQLLAPEVHELKLEKFYHPGKGKWALFITADHGASIMEVLEYAEPRRSWLLNQEVCSNGKLYLTTPIDTTFFALHYLRKHCMHRALALDSIREEQDDSVGRLLTTYVRHEQLKCISDVKTAGDNMTFYKYNSDKAMAWLALKARRIAEAFRRKGVYCGHSALSQNYAKSEEVDQIVQDGDYLRMACDFVGDYIDLELHVELTKYLSLPTEHEANKEANEKISKRKSLQALNASGNKKIKLDTDEHINEDLKDNGLGNNVPNEHDIKPTLAKEKPLTAKEKALAKSAKGSKSIASFFKR